MKRKKLPNIFAAHEDEKIKIIEVDNFSLKGSGPGYSLLSCRSELKCPFIFFSDSPLKKKFLYQIKIGWG